MLFDEALSGFGFHASQGRAPRGAKLFTAEPNRYLTYSMHAYEDGTALFTWEFALGEYLLTIDDDVVAPDGAVDRLLALGSAVDDDVGTWRHRSD